MNKKNNITLNYNSERAITAVAECFKKYLGKMHTMCILGNGKHGCLLVTDPNILNKAYGCIAM